MTKASLPLNDDTADCAVFRPLLDDLVAEEVDAVSMARAEVHLSQCAPCRFALAQARAYRRVMRRVGQGQRASAALRNRAVELVRDTRDSRGSPS